MTYGELFKKLTESVGIDYVDFRPHPRMINEIIAWTKYNDEHHFRYVEDQDRFVFIDEAETFAEMLAKIPTKRIWHKVTYDGFDIEGEVLPRDGQWSYWKDIHGNIAKGRFKFDCQDHFFPDPIPINSKEFDEENIISWSELTQ